MIHRPVTLTPSAQRRLADTQHAAGLGHTHALTSQRLSLLQLHDNLLRRVLRERPHGHPLCPATHGQDYSEQPSRNKRSENSDPSRCNTHLSGVTPLSDKPNHSQGFNHTRGTTPVTWHYARYVALHPLRGTTPVTWHYTRYVALHPFRTGAMPTDRVHRPHQQAQPRICTPPHGQALHHWACAHVVEGLFMRLWSRPLIVAGIGVVSQGPEEGPAAVQVGGGRDCPGNK